jgi:hypothetical protein
MKKLNDFNLFAFACIIAGAITLAYQCQKDQCEIYGAWNYRTIIQGDTVKSVYCFTKDSMIIVFRGKTANGRLSIPISVSPNEINVFDAKGQVWPYENTCDTLLVNTGEEIQMFWR